MKRTPYNKIVRDKIPQIIEQSGKRAVIRTADKASALLALEAKLTEELNEYLDDHSVEELADLVEVIHGILYYRGLGLDELERIRIEKRDLRGGFEAGIILQEVIEP